MKYILYFPEGDIVALWDTKGVKGTGGKRETERDKSVKSVGVLNIGGKKKQQATILELVDAFVSLFKNNFYLANEITILNGVIIESKKIANEKKKKRITKEKKARERTSEKNTDGGYEVNLFIKHNDTSQVNKVRAQIEIRITSKRRDAKIFCSGLFQKIIRDYLHDLEERHFVVCRPVSNLGRIAI